MIARVYESVEKKRLQKAKKQIQKERKVKKKVESWEERYIDQKPQEGHCGRCNHNYKYGDNIREPEKCPRCVCIDCGKSIMERRRLATYGGSVARCYSCWYKYKHGRQYYGSISGWEISYDHVIPHKLPPIKKKVPIEKEVDAIEQYTEEIEIDELVSVFETQLADRKNIEFPENNKAVFCEFSCYHDFINQYSSAEKYFQDSELTKNSIWYGSNSHKQTLQSLESSKNIETIQITSLASLDYNQLIIGEKQTVEEFPSVVGFYPNVPAYIRGNPLNMYNNRRINKVDIEKSINIYLNVTMDSKCVESQYKNRGIICFSLVDFLVNEENIKVNLKLIDASFTLGETCIQTIDFDFQTIKKDPKTLYNFLTSSAVLRVMMLESKASLVKTGKLDTVWLDGFGYYIQDTKIKKILQLSDNDILFGTPDELRISGIDIEDDFINCMEHLGIHNSYYFEENIAKNRDSYIEKNNSAKSIIDMRGITKLIHFTSENNIESIMEHGLLSRKTLSDFQYEFDFNDYQRLEKKHDAICLSVEVPNDHLIAEYMKRFPEKKYKILEISPTVLYEHKKDDALVDRIYCDYNAASRYSQKSMIDMEIMYKNELRKRHIIYNREGKQDNLPTCDQAEILFLGDIPSKYIINTLDYRCQETGPIIIEDIKGTSAEITSFAPKKDISNKRNQGINKYITIKGIKNKNRVVSTYKKTFLESVTLSEKEIRDALANNVPLYIKVGSDYSYKELSGKIVLLSRIGQTTTGAIRYYFNKDDEVSISEKNIVEIFTERNSR